MFNSLLLIVVSTFKGCSGFELFLRGCNDLNSSLLFFVGTFAGIYITGAFEERKIQLVVMAGNSRFNILVAKLLSYSLTVEVICISTTIPSFAIASFAEGTVVLTDDFFREVVLRVLVYTFVEISWVEDCLRGLGKEQKTTFHRHFLHSLI